MPWYYVAITHTFLLQNIITISFKTYRRCLYRKKRFFILIVTKNEEGKNQWKKVRKSQLAINH